MSPFENEAAATAAEGVEKTGEVEIFEPSEPVGETLGGDPAPETGESEPEGNEKAEPTGENVSGPEEPVASSGNSIPLRFMKAGTKLKLGATEVVLYKDAWFTYPEAENEPHFAATCQMTGNYEINAAELEAQYDLNGRVIEG